MTGQPRNTRNALLEAGQSLAAAAALGLLAAQGTESSIRRLDRAVTGWLPGRRRPAMTEAARLTSALAEPGVAAAAVAVAALIAARRSGWQAAVVPCLAVAGGARVRRMLSGKIARQRPPEANWLVEPEGFSMPSKHTSVAALTAGACAACLGGGIMTRHGATLAAAAAVGASRVYLGVHWPSDVLAGWLFAEGWLDLTLAVTHGEDTWK